MRHKLAYLLFGLSSLFKGLGKAVITKENMIVVDMLTLPGYFIVDCHLMKNTKLENGFQRETWRLPDQYIEDMNKLRRKRHA